MDPWVLRDVWYGFTKRHQRVSPRGGLARPRCSRLLTGRIQGALIRESGRVKGGPLALWGTERKTWLARKPVRLGYGGFINPRKRTGLIPPTHVPRQTPAHKPHLAPPVSHFTPMPTTDSITNIPARTHSQPSSRSTSPAQPFSPNKLSLAPTSPFSKPGQESRCSIRSGPETVYRGIVRFLRNSLTRPHNSAYLQSMRGSKRRQTATRIPPIPPRPPSPPGISRLLVS